MRKRRAGSRSTISTRPTAALACVLLAAGAAPAADLPAIRARGTLRVLTGVDAERREFFTHPRQEPPGFDRELVEGFCRRHKLQLEVVPETSSEELIEALRADRGDLIAGRFRVDEERQRRMAFTVETFPSRLVVITRRPHRVVTELPHLLQEKVGTMSGTVMVDELIKAGVPSESIMRLPMGDLPAALRSGRITAGVWGVESAMAMQRQDPDVQIGMFLGRPGSIAWAVRKQDTQLLRALNEHIEESRKSVWSRLVVRYFGSAAVDILKRARSAD